MNQVHRAVRQLHRLLIQQQLLWLLLLLQRQLVLLSQQRLPVPHRLNHLNRLLDCQLVRASLELNPMRIW